jgi:hypothetical protein
VAIYEEDAETGELEQRGRFVPAAPVAFTEVVIRRGGADG